MDNPHNDNEIKCGLVARPAFLAVKDKLPDRFLFAGRIEKKDQPELLLFYLIEIMSPWFHFAKIKNAILQVLDKGEINPDTISPATFFEESVMAINQNLEKSAKKEEKEWLSNLNAVIGLVDNDQLLLTQAGYVPTYIFRKGKISSITEKPSLAAPEINNIFSEIVAGKITNGDRVIIGNTELYNHISLDRLRRLSEGRPAKETSLELFRLFRKARIAAINTIVLELIDHKKVEEETLDMQALPEICYLDEPAQTIFTKIKKHLQPAQERFATNFAKLNQSTTKHSSALIEKSKETWKDKYQPKAKVALEKSKAGVSSSLAKFQSNLKPAVSKIGKSVKPAGSKAQSFDKLLERCSILINKFLILATNAAKPQNRKYLYGSLIIIFLAIGYAKIQANNANRMQIKEQEKIASAYDEAQDAYTQGKEAIALNKSGGLEKLNEAVALARKSMEDEQNKAKATQLLREIQSQLDSQTSTTRLYDLVPSFSLGDKNVVITLAGSEIYGISEEGKIYRADVREKTPQLVASIGKDYGTAKDISYNADSNLLFIFTSNNKVLSFEPNSKTFAELTIADDSGRWEEAKSIASYVSNLYLLDSEAGEIWKHVKREAGYAKGSVYANTSKTSLRGSVDFAIDGDIYVLMNTGEVRKFVKGDYDDTFTLKSPPSPGNAIEIPAEIITSADSNYLYVLDKKLNRVVSFDKSGNFVKQYTIDETKIESFVANTKLKQAWLQSSGKIYEINL